ncbi:MAG: hypothetical protein FXV79_00940 [Candidatus Thioglobus sp.]|nr:MAG: hypothetical protein FXV80_01540 [Candidatus Thioglobus sp.]KAA0456329.1 MAG: hypothetical protein FXV79_00940 [Candidatus Thioglobus sp.]
MSKINSIAIVFSCALLSACGFHTPTNTQLNASITGNIDGDFATELKKYFDINAQRSLTVNIGAETKKEQVSAYEQGDSSSYILTFSVPIKILDNKKLLLSKTLTATTAVSDLPTQANNLQIISSYKRLRSEVVGKLLRRLKTLK